MIAGREIVRAPFPDVACDIVQAVAIWLIRVDRRGSEITIFLRVFCWKASLPDVATVLTFRRKLITPRICVLLQPATRSELPFRLCRQAAARPAAIGLPIIPRDVHDGVVQSIKNSAIWPLRLSPISA